MPSFYSYNVIGQGWKGRDHFKRLKPSAIFYMDDLAEARWAADNLAGCKVIHRVFASDEAVLHRKPNRMLEYIQQRSRETPDRRIYFNLACEPNIDSENDLRLLVSETLIAMRWAVINNVRVAGPHLAHYGFEERHWPILEPLTTYIAQHADLLLFTCDEYFAGHAFSGVLDPALGDNQIGHIQPEHWQASPIPHYYHKGRILNFFAWLVAHGFKLPLTVITEDGADALNDVQAWRNTLARTRGFDDIRGWMSLVAQWGIWYPQWSAQRAFLEMLVAFWREVYRRWPNIIGSCIYCWGTNNDPQWNQFRMDEALEFQSRLEQVSFMENVPMGKPTNAGIGIPARLRTTGFIRVRVNPLISANVVAEPTNGTLLTYYPGGAVKTDGYMWHWVELADGKSGWQALLTEYPYQQWVGRENVSLTFRIPASYPNIITGKFNDVRTYGKHEGMDFASLANAPAPHLVVAASAGTVEKVGFDPEGYGNYVRVYHGFGWRTYYGHLEKVLVIPNQAVAEGQVIGWEGSTGNSTGPHVHFTVQHYGYGLSGYVVEEVLDPAPLVRAVEPPKPDPFEIEQIVWLDARYQKK